MSERAKQITENEKLMLKMATDAVNQANVQWSFVTNFLSRAYNLGPEDEVFPDGTIHYGVVGTINGDRTSAQAKAGATEQSERTDAGTESDRKVPESVA